MSSPVLGRRLLLPFLFLPLAKAAGAAPRRVPTWPFRQTGLASFYTGRGRRTASGERFSPFAMTAAHRTLPFGTWVRVTRLDTLQAVVVRINDSGPSRRLSRRIIDLTPHAAHQLGVTHAGLTLVQIDALDPKFR